MTMTEKAANNYLTNQFLIAMPNLQDPNFFHSVTYICEHNEYGAMGIVINQPVNLTFGELAEQIGLTPEDDTISQQQVYCGGPVEMERGFVLHRPRGNWKSTLDVSDEIAVSTSQDIVEAMAQGKGPSDSLVALGYAGWGAGQLEREIGENSWLSGPADARIIFQTKVQKRWEEAAKLLGVDINQIVSEAGHS